MRWVLPQYYLMGPSGGISENLARYHNRSVGNSLPSCPYHFDLTRQNGIGDRKGRRHIPRSQLGGKRARTLAEDCYDQGKIELHEDAALAPAAITHKAELKFETQDELDNE
eukprot:jgi/Psemu1/54145/gm1.54145_g